MKALALAQADSAQGKLSRQRQLELRDVIDEIVDELSDHPDDLPAKAKKKTDPDAVEQREAVADLPPVVLKEQLFLEWQVPYLVLCVASRRPPG